jgi:hypothetical protein
MPARHWEDDVLCCQSGGWDDLAATEWLETVDLKKTLLDEQASCVRSIAVEDRDAADCGLAQNGRHVRVR